jgi:hypothetical protein
MLLLLLLPWGYEKLCHTLFAPLACCSFISRILRVGLRVVGALVTILFALLPLAPAVAKRVDLDPAVISCLGVWCSGSKKRVHLGMRVTCHKREREVGVSFQESCPHQCPKE